MSAFIGMDPNFLAEYTAVCQLAARNEKDRAENPIPYASLSIRRYSVR